MKRIVSTILLVILLTSMLCSAFKIMPAEAAGTIYIRADGSIDPPTAPIMRNGDIYTLTGDIASEANGIIIERDNVLFDGAGFIIQYSRDGPGANGILLEYRTNVTIKNTHVDCFSPNILIQDCSIVNVVENNLTKGEGVVLIRSFNCSILGNDIDYPGGLPVIGFVSCIRLDNSSNNNIFGNHVTRAYYNIALLYSSDNYIQENSITNASGSGIVVSSSGNTISGNNITNNGNGVYFGYLSSGNNVSGNNITNNYCGLYCSFEQSGSNTISGNNITGNHDGIFLTGDASDFVVCGNYIGANVQGVLLQGSSNSTFCGNNMTENTIGVFLEHSSNNTFCENIIENTGVGITLFYSGGNVFGRNIIINNVNSFDVYGWELPDFLNSVDSSNTVDGKPIYYWIDLRDMSVPLDAGYVALVNCTRITVHDLNLTSTLRLAYTTSSLIIGNTLTGSITLHFSSENRIYHNSIAGGGCYPGCPPNIWDDGYPSGGNYWSGFNPPDIFSGPYQNQTGSDKIGDTPYITGADNADSYPLIYPFGYVPSPDFNNDGIIDIFDIVRMALAFGSVPGMPNWDPYVDLNQDGIIDIFDLVVVALRFGETV